MLSHHRTLHVILISYPFSLPPPDITSLMAGLSNEQKENDCIGFSLKLRAAWSLGNYHRFFKLYRVAPKMAGYLVDWFADRERKQALRAMLKGFVFYGNKFTLLITSTHKQCQRVFMNLLN